MPADTTPSIAQRMAEVLALDPTAVAVEANGVASTWGDIAAAAAAVEAELVRLGVPKAAPIGWVARNGAPAVAVFAGLLLHGRPIAPLRPNQAVAGFIAEIGAQRVQVIVGPAADWDLPGVAEAARAAGSAGIRLTDRPGGGFEVALQPGLEKVGPGPHRPDDPTLVLERLSSGTTGPPKRIPVHADTILAALRGTEESQSVRAGEPLRLKSSPGIILSPFTHAGGIFGLVLALYQARPVVVFDKFEVSRWVEAVQKYKPKSASLVPAMIKMILAADPPREALASLMAVRSGTAGIDPKTQVAFEERFGIPILVDYGAAEFMGGVTGWSLGEHRQFSKTKLGSVGRPRPDVQLRTIDPETKTLQPVGEVGQLEIFCPRWSPDWIRTNDFARLDEDGFLYIHGRLDDAINRGGFKIRPDDVAPIIREFPGVQDATLVAFPDERLGQVPVAIVETAGGQPLDAAALKAFLKDRLAPYQVPVDIRFIAAFPRTTTMKISRPELKAMLGLG